MTLNLSQLVSEHRLSSACAPKSFGSKDASAYAIAEHLTAQAKEIGAEFGSFRLPKDFASVFSEITPHAKAALLKAMLNIVSEQTAAYLEKQDHACGKTLQHFTMNAVIILGNSTSLVKTNPASNASTEILPFSRDELEGLAKVFYEYSRHLHAHDIRVNERDDRSYTIDISGGLEGEVRGSIADMWYLWKQIGGSYHTLRESIRAEAITKK